MSRRSNLNTLRKNFNWNSSWTTVTEYYTHIVWMDIKITGFLNGLFYVLRMPSSSYIIRRFLNSFVIIEADVWLCGSICFKHFLHNISYFSYLVYKLRKLWSKANIRYKYTSPLHRVRRIIYYFIGKLFKYKSQVMRLRSSNQDVVYYDSNTLRKRSSKLSISMLSLWDCLSIRSSPLIFRSINSSAAPTAAVLSIKHKNAEMAWHHNTGVTRHTYQRKRKHKSKRIHRHRIVIMSMRRHCKYLKRYCGIKIAAYRKFMRMSRHSNRLLTSSISKRSRSLAIVWCSMHLKYYELINRICSTTKLCYRLRDSWNIALSFRLIKWYVTYSFRSSAFMKFNTQLVSIPNPYVNNALSYIDQRINPLFNTLISKQEKRNIFNLLKLRNVSKYHV